MTWVKLLLLSLAFIIGSTDAIINGKDAKIENFPYQVSICLFEKHVCGGSIISERHILTAAHCAKLLFNHDKSLRNKSFFIISGTSDRCTGGIKHEIANVIVHPDYWMSPDKAWMVKDIAVITLKDSIVFNEYQQKIKIPQNNYIPGRKANMTGWGYVEEKNQVFPDQLQMMEMTVISKEECEKRLTDSEKITIFQSEICVSHDPKTHVCMGDSGGALVIDGEVVGIASWCDGETCLSRYPTVFTNVYKFQDFIRVAMMHT